MVKLKNYTFLIGDNMMYNQTVIRRVRWFNLPFARSGLCNIKKVVIKAPSEELARISAAVLFETEYGRFAHIMGHRIR